MLVAQTEFDRASRLGRLADIEQRFAPIPVDARVARGYGRLAAAVEGAGAGPEPVQWIS